MRLPLAMLLASAAVVIHGADLTAQYCPASHDTSRCQEYNYPRSGVWQQDEDCCACQDSGITPHPCTKMHGNMCNLQRRLAVSRARKHKLAVHSRVPARAHAQVGAARVLSCPRQRCKGHVIRPRQTRIAKCGRRVACLMCLRVGKVCVWVGVWVCGCLGVCTD